jgi:hypothetical protein
MPRRTDCRSRRPRTKSTPARRSERQTPLSFEGCGASTRCVHHCPARQSGRGMAGPGYAEQRNLIVESDAWRFGGPISHAAPLSRQSRASVSVTGCVVIRSCGYRQSRRIGRVPGMAARRVDHLWANRSSRHGTGHAVLSALRTMPIQPAAPGHSPSSGMANTPDKTGTSAPKAAPREAPSMLTARP